MVIYFLALIYGLRWVDKTHWLALRIILPVAVLIALVVYGMGFQLGFLKYIPRNNGDEQR